jgi:hypothetical protein
MDVKGTAIQFAASVPKRRLSAHFIAIAEMMELNVIVVAPRL